MNKLLMVIVVVGLFACGGGNNENANPADTTTSAESTVGTMNTDTTSVDASAIQTGKGQLRTDTAVRGINASGK